MEGGQAAEIRYAKAVDRNLDDWVCCSPWTKKTADRKVHDWLCFGVISYNI